MGAVAAVTRKEVKDALRSSWLPMYGGLLAALALALAYLGQENLGGLGFEGFSRTTASLLNLCLLLAPLVALPLAAQTIAGDRDRGTLAYVLSQPIERWELLTGKFLGLLVGTGLATSAGFGLAGVVIAFSGSSMNVGTYLLFVLLVVALIGAMLSLGLAISVVSTSRLQALGFAVLAWFAAVLLLDVVLIGLVSVTSLGGTGLFLALLANPVEIVRVLAIIRLEPDLQVLGPFGSYVLETLGVRGATVVLGAALTAWVLAPLLFAGWLFKRQEA